MTREELKQTIRGSTSKNISLPLADLAKLKAMANVRLEIDRETNDYYYHINIDDLVDKDIDISILTDNNWQLSLDEKSINLFI